MKPAAATVSATGEGSGRHCRPAWAEVDLAAIRHNASVLAAAGAPAELCAVVKAGGYGHGAPEVAWAALQGGAAWLAVALVEEGRDLREAGITAPILVLSEPPGEAMIEVVTWSLTPTLYTRAGARALEAALAGRPGGDRFPVHVKVDTGMHRVGAQPSDAVALAGEVAASSWLQLDGFWTHLAVSDEVADSFTSVQIDRFNEAVDALSGRGIRPRLLHAANSGGLLWHRRSHFDMVRCGISLYGLAPAPPAANGAVEPDRAVLDQLRPALSLKAGVSFVKTLPAGERLSYGRRYVLAEESVVATVPLGYADGIPRSLAAARGEVLVGGRRRPVAGTVTMDQILVDCGPDADVAAGDEVVLIGSQGKEHIGAWDWAQAVGTIAYEIVCGIGGRVPRVYVDRPRPAPGSA